MIRQSRHPRTKPRHETAVARTDPNQQAWSGPGRRLDPHYRLQASGRAWHPRTAPWSAKEQDGTTAIEFVLSSGGVVDKVHEAFEGTTMELVKTNLSHEQEAKLREVFGD